MVEDAENSALEVLLQLDGHEFDFGNGHKVNMAAWRVDANPHQPAGIRYSLTLHDSSGERIYGIDNADQIKPGLPFDHRHQYRQKKRSPYKFRGAAEMLEDFFKDVDRILKIRGVR